MNLSLLEKTGMGVFCYGFLRGIRAEYPAPYDTVGSRLCFSFFNGINYILPPFTILKMIHAIDRCDVYLTKKDPEKYPHIYECFPLISFKFILI